MRHVCVDQIACGTLDLSMGAMMRSGFWSSTDSIIVSSLEAIATLTLWPRSVSSTKSRWLRLLCAEVRKWDFHDGAPKAVVKEISSKDGDCRPRVGCGVLCSGD